MKNIVYKAIGIGLLIALIFIGYISIQVLTQFKKLNQGELVEEHVLDTIPFTYSSSGHIILQTRINGSQKLYPFALDCGAANFIFSNHVDEFDLETNGRAFGIGSSGDFFLSKIRKIDSLQIGNLHFNMLNANEAPFHFDCSEETYGLIGTGIMRHLVWQVDFENKIIIVASELKRLQIGKNAIRIPLSENKYGHHLRVGLQIGKKGSRISTLVDLGNSGILSLSSKTLHKDSARLLNRVLHTNYASGLGNDEREKREEVLYLVDTLILGYHFLELPKVPVHTSPKALNLLGLGFFKHYRTTISWADRKLILEPYENTQDFTWKTSGFWTKYNKEKQVVEISGLIEGMSAAKSGVKLGDQVISINGYPLTDESALCMFKKDRLGKADTINLITKRDGVVKNYSFLREPVFKRKSNKND